MLAMLEPTHSVNARERNLAPDESLFLEGQTPTALYEVKSGCIKLVRSASNGRETITDLLFPGDFFDLGSLLDGQPYQVSARSVSGSYSKVACHERGAALADGALIAKAQGQWLDRLRFQRRMLAAIATERVEQRAIMALWMLAELSGRRLPCGNSLSFVMPLTRQELGEFIGTTNETAIRVLSDLRRRGWIVEERHTITICQPDELHALCAA